MVICLGQDAHLPMAQLMPLRLTVSCLSKIHVGCSFLVPAFVSDIAIFVLKRDVKLQLTN